MNNQYVDDLLRGVEGHQGGITVSPDEMGRIGKALLGFQFPRNYGFSVSLPPSRDFRVGPKGSGQIEHGTLYFRRILFNRNSGLWRKECAFMRGLRGITEAAGFYDSDYMVNRMMVNPGVRQAIEDSSSDVSMLGVFRLVDWRDQKSEGVELEPFLAIPGADPTVVREWEKKYYRFWGKGRGLGVLSSIKAVKAERMFATV
ncbi:MAG: hypothetical protein KKF56_03685 [Nanoarchaeota archaeon]|nr:hypothetical protein [Nanoarchaeota archaeon]